jgi:hypothetical protein
MPLFFCFLIFATLWLLLFMLLLMPPIPCFLLMAGATGAAYLINKFKKKDK